MVVPQRLVCALISGFVFFFVHTVTVYPQAIIPRDSVISTITGRSPIHTDTNYSKDARFGGRRFLTTTRFIYEAWGERSQPWAEERELLISHGYEGGTIGVEAGVCLDGNENLGRFGSFLNWDAPSYGSAHLRIHDDPEFSVGVALPIEAGFSLLLGGFRREVSDLSVPAFDTPFDVNGAPRVTGVHGGVQWKNRRVYARATAGTAAGSLDGTVVPSAIGFSGTVRLRTVYTGSVGYDGRTIALSAGAVHGDVDGDVLATFNDNVIGSAEPESDSAGVYRSWDLSASFADSFRLGVFSHYLRIDGFAGYLDLGDAAPMLNGLIPDRFRYTVTDILVDLSETGVTVGAETSIRRWDFQLGGTLSSYTAKVTYGAFYRRLAVIREEVGATLVDDDGYLLTTSAGVTIPLVPLVTLSVTYTGIVPVSFDYLRETDPVTVVRDGADAATTWQGYRLGLALRVAAPVFE